MLLEIAREEADVFEKVIREVSTREDVKKCHNSDMYFIFGEDHIGDFILFIYSRNGLSSKFYLAEHLLYKADNKYYEKLNHKLGRIDYLKSLGVKDYQITTVRRSNLKVISEALYGMHRRISVFGQRKCVLVHESALTNLKLEEK